MKEKRRISRRNALKGLGVAGALATMASPAPSAELTASQQPIIRTGNLRKEIEEAVQRTLLIDTHEHLIDEKERLSGVKSPRIQCDDWALLFSHYLNSDLITAGMPSKDMNRFLSPGVEPIEKWKLLAPFWPSVRHTGYGQAVALTIKELYGVDYLSSDTVNRVQEGYEKTRKPGFYSQILNTLARIESCQVNSLTGEPFKKSSMPQLLMQDISIVGMFAGPSIQQYAGPAGMNVSNLSDWHRVIDWWFEKYARYAVAAKSQQAYSRDIDYARVPAEKAEPIFRKVTQKEPVNSEERKQLEDHLFWYAVDQATKHGLPVKLHTGYYAGHNSMPLSRLLHNAGSAAELCRQSPNTQFVFMHICYPYYEEILSVAKQWANAHVDMCWAWIINPLAAKDYFKKHLVTAPLNKLLPFGGDYIPVEPVLGHAIIARKGITNALTELVEEGWLRLPDAIDLLGTVMNGNARRLFRISEKSDALKKADWI